MEKIFSRFLNKSAVENPDFIHKLCGEKTLRTAQKTAFSTIHIAYCFFYYIFYLFLSVREKGAPI